MKAKYLLFLVLLVSVSCNRSEQEDLDMEKVDAAYRELALQNCTGCHRFPEPEFLDKETWRSYVLPAMGHFYGIYKNKEEREKLLGDGSGREAILAAGLFPEERQVDSLTWYRISQYYLRNSLEKMDVQQRDYSGTADIFELQTPDFTLSPPSSTLVKFTPDGKLMLGDVNSASVYIMNENFELDKTAHVREGAVDVHVTENDWWVTVLGTFAPSDDASGLIVRLPKDGSSEPEIVLEELQRPVDALFDDFNGDGREDILVSEFGKWTGNLSLFVNKGEGDYQKVIIENRSGARKAESRDLNGDGAPDIIALFGQGVEAIEAFINDGNGNFTRETKIELEPTFGSSHFCLYDMDGDGDEDIVYTSGDNADYLPILKPYHGVYIYLNDGRYNFSQSEFLPQNGAYKAIPADFDGDGDIDIASISFFPDYADQPNEGFMFFEYTNGAYQGKTLDNLRYGRWISMDMADYDKDGDMDLVLGSMAFETVPPQPDLESNWINQGIPFVVLENKSN